MEPCRTKGSSYQVVGTHSNFTMRWMSPTSLPVGNNLGFCAFKSHIWLPTRTHSGCLCRKPWTLGHCKVLIFKTRPGVGVFYVKKGSVGGGSRVLGSWEGRRRTGGHLCMLVCVYVCARIHMWVFACECACTCVCWSVWYSSWESVCE